MEIGLPLVGALIVVWVVVLAPLLLREHKPIHRAGDAFDETRVIYEGGEELPAKRRPRSAPPTEEEQPEIPEDEYEIVPSPADRRVKIPKCFRKNTSANADEEAMPSESSELAADTLAADTAEVLEPTEVTGPEEIAESEGIEQSESDIVDAEVVEIDAQEEDIDPAFITPADLMHPTMRGHETVTVASSAGESSVDEEPELTEADLEFAEKRKGRGLYDPEADERHAQDNYLRRQRTLIALAVAAVLGVLLGFIFGSWTWLIPLAITVITGLYLVALRNQVHAENQLRAARIRRLHRLRLGVRHADQTPERLRRPGAVVLEVDDESPDFDELEYAEIVDDDHQDFPPRRVG